MVFFKGLIHGYPWHFLYQSCRTLSPSSRDEIHGSPAKLPPCFDTVPRVLEDLQGALPWVSCMESIDEGQVQIPQMLREFLGKTWISCHISRPWLAKFGSCTSQVSTRKFQWSQRVPESPKLPSQGHEGSAAESTAMATTAVSWRQIPKGMGWNGAIRGYPTGLDKKQISEILSSCCFAGFSDFSVHLWLMLLLVLRLTCKCGGSLKAIGTCRKCRNVLPLVFPCLCCFHLFILLLIPGKNESTSSNVC